MRTYILTKTLPVLGLVLASLSYAQTNTENYVQSKTCLNDDCTKVSEAITYFDGLGRAKQIISVKSTPAGKDLVTPVTYDGFGRKVKDILPVPAPTQNSMIHTGIVNESSANTYYGVSNAYSEKEVENSSLDRVLQQAAPGEPWKMSSGKTQKLSYDANLGNEVKKFRAVTSPSTVNNVSTGISVLSLSTENSGYYPASTLYKNTVTDEDGNPVTEFTNGQGQTLLVRRNDGGQNVDTYYVYNDYNQLAYVLSPKAVQQMAQANNQVTEAVLNELCYQYRYDGRSRLVEKKLPGKDWEWMVYDKQDRLVLTQDGILRTAVNTFNTRGWLFTKYDGYNRTVLTGFYPNTESRTAVQDYLNNLPATSLNPLNNEYRITNSVVIGGMNVYYRNLAYPSTGTILLGINYYDTYPPEAPAIPATVLGQYTLGQATNAANDASTNSLPTASYVRNIEDNKWTKNYPYYDTMGRVVFTHSINHLGGYTKTESLLDFAGVPQKANTYHLRKAGEVGVSVQERFVYDSQNRLKQHFHQVDANPEELLTENTYNELSQLSNKKVGNNLQSIDYAYNIRGWLTDINKAEMTVSNLNGKLFAYTIKYNQKDGIANPDSVLFSGKNVAAKYNGNIAEVDWRAVETLGQNPSLTPKRYGYAYDPLNRLRAGYYQNPNNPNSKENIESIDYDLNGNITNLYRTSIMEAGNTATTIDRLEYSYASGNKSNRLTSIVDIQNNPTGYEGGGQEIKYDLNGNMTVMPDKGISKIAYNYLNLPDQLNYAKGFETVTVNTKYGSDGSKLQKKNTTTVDGISGSSTLIKTTDYLDGFQYLKTDNIGLIGMSAEMMANLETSRALEMQAFSVEPMAAAATLASKTRDLQFFPTAEGFYDYLKDQYIYQYKDHLGNVRMSFSRSSAGALEITDSNDYYPFGMNHLKTGFSFFSPASAYKNYKYNGKELQETGMYDYGARFYMPDIGRWGVVDPLAEKYTRMSPYTYVGNNPAIFVDYDGRDFGMSIDMKKGTITITGNYYALSRDMKAANGAIGKWNKVSGDYSYHYKDANGLQKSLKVVFKLTTTEVKSTAKNDLKNALNDDKSGTANSFIVDDQRMGQQLPTTVGITGKGKVITVRSTAGDDTGGHEVGHTLGLDDDKAITSDIMTHTSESGDTINSNYIQNILSYFDGNTANPNKASDKTKIEGNPNSVIVNTSNTNLKTDKDYENFKKGKVKYSPEE